MLHLGERTMLPSETDLYCFHPCMVGSPQPDSRDLVSTSLHKSYFHSSSTIDFILHAIRKPRLGHMVRFGRNGQCQAYRQQRQGVGHATGFNSPNFSFALSRCPVEIKDVPMNRLVADFWQRCIKGTASSCQRHCRSSTHFLLLQIIVWRVNMERQLYPLIDSNRKLSACRYVHIRSLWNKGPLGCHKEQLWWIKLSHTTS